MTLRHAVQAALAAAEAAGLREVADVIVTLARQLEEERHRADVLEDEAVELRASLIKARLVARCQFTARRCQAPLTEEMATFLMLRHPWLRCVGAEEDGSHSPNLSAIER